MTRAARSYDADNLRCARLILSDPARYGGPDSLMVRHSRAVLAHLEGKTALRPAGDRRGQMILLDVEGACRKAA